MPTPLALQVPSRLETRLETRSETRVETRLDTRLDTRLERHADADANAAAGALNSPFTPCVCLCCGYLYPSNTPRVPAISRLEYLLYHA